MDTPIATHYIWTPGLGPDAVALERMSAHFLKPREPMGEAWFMSEERRMYPELQSDLVTLHDDEIERPLEDIVQGATCFGGGAEWTEWYHYLLPRLILRDWGTYIYHPAELLITGFMTQHPASDGNRPYSGFQSDALVTLGRCIMSPDNWPGGNVDVEKCLNKFMWPSGQCGWFDADGLLSASLFFCLKYLPESAVAPWFNSVFAIKDPFWNAQLFVWAVGAAPLLFGSVDQPSELPEHDEPFNVSWNWSHALDGNYTGEPDKSAKKTEFLPAANRETAVEIVRRVDAEAFFDRLKSDPNLAQVTAETVGLEERFMQLYR